MIRWCYFVGGPLDGERRQIWDSILVVNGRGRELTDEQGTKVKVAGEHIYQRDGTSERFVYLPSRKPKGAK